VDPGAEEELAVPTSRSAERVAPAVFLVLALTAIGIFGIWTAHDGGFAPGQWLPGALTLVGLLLTAAASSDIRTRFAAAPGAPLLFILYTIWSYASIGWPAATARRDVELPRERRAPARRIASRRRMQSSGVRVASPPRLIIQRLWAWTRRRARAGPSSGDAAGVRAYD
jgi:hypothetical protein